MHPLAGGLGNEHAEARADGHRIEEPQSRGERHDVLIVVSELDTGVAPLVKACDSRVAIVHPCTRPDREPAEDDIVAHRHSDMDLIGTRVSLDAPEHNPVGSTRAWNIQVHPPIE